ncbi:sensor domain-containing protein [Kineosporia sp. J2-2]|uniref:histidine kinase n=1 Tax=Kineosporia corallincola TaxID=2835133 RepID=A0ABS5TGC0_9ACTN|nr:sensor histidine kinase [Kineosporia corallincola]MBT0770095.1 sensor domain-containing protein [Kineosporia corallincola]
MDEGEVRTVSGRQAALAVARGPVSRQAWLDTAYLCVNVPLGIAGAAGVLVLITLAATLAVSVVGGLVASGLLLFLVRVLTDLQRSRHLAFRGVPIPPDRPDYAERGWFGRRLTDLRSEGFWRQTGYHLLAAASGAGALLVGLGWVAGVALTLLPSYGWSLPSGGPFGTDLHLAVTQIGFCLAGVVILLATPLLAAGLAEADSRAAQALLGVNRRIQLGQRLTAVGAGRAAAVSAADAERRRIERDLHDGVQQRLMSLAMNLGILRTAHPDLPEGAKLAVQDAHEEAKLVLSELRDLVRGLYPAVLDDRGLDAALSGIAARSAVPVRLEVDLPEQRPPIALEAVAYFVVAETLTNAVRHSGATTVDIAVHEADGVLRVQVTDDGVGGARVGGGSGLKGLTDRVASVDGTLRIDSPAGGPTTITAELPCAF